MSPYLQQPLRTMDEVRAERERRQREFADAVARRLADTADDEAVAPPRLNRAV